MPLPSKKVIYKYLPDGDYLPQVLSGQSLKFESPLDFNDPFECQVVVLIEHGASGLGFIRGELKKYKLPVRKRLETIQAMKRIQGKPLFSDEFPLMTALLRNVGVSCFSGEYNDILMWAHYAKHHTGVCIGFDTAKHMFQTAWEVEYKEQLPVILRPTDSYEDMLRKSLITKSSHWKYECEWRIVKRTLSPLEREEIIKKYGQMKPAQADVILNQVGPGYYSFPKEAITEIILGAKMLLRDKQKIVAWAGEAGLAVPIREARRHRSEYRLEFVEIAHPTGGTSQGGEE